MKSKFILTAALMVSGSMAFAGMTAEQIAADLQAQGYTRIAIKQGPSQIKAEAMRGTERLETVYDAASGDVLKSSVRGISADDHTDTGVSVRSRDRDFVRTAASGQSDDDTRAEDHRSRDRDQSADSDDRASGSDSRESDHSGNHDRGRDHDRDGDHDRGSDHDRDSDHDRGSDHDSGDDHDSNGDHDDGEHDSDHD